MKNMDLSIVVPVYNEEGSLKELHKRLVPVLSKLSITYEIVFVDDGSSDRSYKILKGIEIKDKNVKVIGFVRNFGQTTAIAAGVEFSSGKILLTMEADLQNDPRDIPKLINQINNGYDVVSGWRKNRHSENFFTKRVPSIAANILISKIVGLNIHDFGCTFKAYKSTIVKPLRLYGEMHRLILAYAYRRGAKITEVPISYQTRKFGKSKYNLSRTYKVIFDLITLMFIENFATKPMYVFGTFGFFCFGGGIVSGSLMIFNKFNNGTSIISSPFLLFTFLFMIFGTMFIVLGLLAEIIVRTYYESQGKKTYIVREK